MYNHLSNILTFSALRHFRLILTSKQWNDQQFLVTRIFYFYQFDFKVKLCILSNKFAIFFILDYRESLKIPRLVINNHKSFIRVVEIPAAKKSLLEGNKDFVLLDSTSSKLRYSTLKLQELNAKLKALQEQNEQVQRALSENLCNQVQIIVNNQHY